MHRRRAAMTVVAVFELPGEDIATYHEVFEDGGCRSGTAPAHQGGPAVSIRASDDATAPKRSVRPDDQSLWAPTISSRVRAT